MKTDRERLHELLDSLPDDRLALADTALTALAMPDAESVIDADRAALATAEQDPERIGHALANYRKRQGWTQDDLAAFLGLTLRQLAALSDERRPLIRTKQGTWSPGSGIYALAEAHGADNHRLFEAIEDRPGDR
jgi:DNA-binding XRE family transcriptional regulator